MELPDLYNPALSERWWFDALRQGITPQQLIALLETDGRPIALARAALLSFTLLDYSGQKSFAARALETEEPEVEAFALAMIALSEWYLNSGLREATNGEALVPMLHDVLDELRRRSHTPLAQEAEYRLRLAIATHLNFVGQFADAKIQASRALTLSIALGLRQTEQTAMYTLAQSVLQSGDLEESYRLLDDIHQRKDANPMVDLRATTQRSLLLASLGNVARALDVLNEAPPTNPGWLEAVRQYVRAHQGNGWSEVLLLSDATWGAPLQWQVIALHGLAKVAFQRTHQQPDGEQLLRQVLELLSAHNTRLGISTFVGWVRGYCYLLLKRHHIAFQATRLTNSTSPPFLLHRALHGALRLEIAVTPGGHQSDSILLLEEELRQVFIEADATPLASSDELARLLFHWHPVASAYLALMPTPVEALFRVARFTDSIVRFSGRTSSAHNLSLPPYYALEAVLRAFGFDHSPTGRPFKQAPLNSRMIAMRDALEIEINGEPFWRPVVPGALLAYGLVKADERLGSSHRRVAQQIGHEWGFLPKGTGEYAEAERYQLEGLLNDLIEGRIDTARFDNNLYR